MRNSDEPVMHTVNQMSIELFSVQLPHNETDKNTSLVISTPGIRTLTDEISSRFRASTPLRVVGTPDRTGISRPSKLLWVDASLDCSQPHPILVLTFGGCPKVAQRRLIERNKIEEEVNPSEGKKNRKKKVLRIARQKVRYLNPKVLVQKFSAGADKKIGTDKKFGIDDSNPLIPRDHPYYLSQSFGHEIWAIGIRLFEMTIYLMDVLCLVAPFCGQSSDLLSILAIEYLRLTSGQNDHSNEFDQTIDLMNRSFHPILVTSIKRPLASYTSRDPLGPPTARNFSSVFLQALMTTRRTFTDHHLLIIIY